MELKVWVDGIQRVVCGANLATTCQDVVMALAHAMGRTGRFTLIEKWRDSERPLTPGECPLKALQKWGEYAAEVRFYLMQAEHQQDKPPQKSPKQRSAQLAETLDDDFSHNFTPPTSQSSHSSSSSSSKHPHHHLPHQQHPNQQPQQRQLIPQASQPVPDSIKRSSTFSGTLNSNHPPIPQSTSLHAKLDNLKQQQQQQQYPQRSHPQHHPQQPPRPNHSGQKRLQQPVNNSNDSNGNTKTPQQYQNVPIAPKPSQNVRSRSNQNTPHPPPPQPPHKPIPIPSSKSQNRPNGNLSARSSGSSNQSASPRNPSTGQHSKSLSPGRGGNNGSVGPIPMSSSPSQDTRHLHPANIPRPSGTYSNFPPPNSDQQQQQQQQQQQPRPKPSTSSSSPSTPRPVPTPRSGHHQPRQQSPSSSSSVPYENLPPVRRSSSSYGTEPPPYPPPPSSSSSSSHPPENQTETEPRPPSRRRRERGRSANDPGNKLENNTQNNIRNEEDENQLKTGRFMSNDKPFVNAPEINQRGGDRLYQKKMNDNKFVLNKLSNNDHNNSDLSDDCFQGPDTSLKTPNNSQSVNYPNKVVNNAPRSAHGKDFPPAPFTKTQMFPPVPQLSQTLPSYSSSSSSPSRSRSSETAAQRLTKSQTLSPSANPVTPERTRRSDGGGRVNFVESALLRQQRSNPDADLNAGRNTERQHRDSSRDGRPSVEQLPHPTGNNRYRGDNSQEFAYPAMSTSHAQYFPGQDEDHYDSRYGNDRNITDFTDSISPQLTNNNHGLSPSDFHHQNHHQQPAQQQHQQRHHHPSPQQSPRTSAFKVVSPRSSSSNRPSPLSSSHSPQSSPISPTSYGTPPVAYNLDSQNFDLPVNLDHHHHLHPSSYPEFPSSSSTSPSNLRPHVRQTSLEIEEYDLDQNFPDVSHKDGLGHHYHQQQSSTLPRIAGRKCQGQGQMTEYVMDRQGVPPPSSSSSSSLEPEYMRMLRQVKMQQEQLKMLESQVNDVDAEISTLETEQSDLDLKLDVVGTELSSLEKTEEMVEAELEELDRVEWVNVLDGEVKCEDDLRSKMSKLTVELAGVEKEIVKVGEEEKTKKEALRLERLRQEEEEKKEEMEAKEAMQRLTETKDDLSSLEASIRQQEEEMKALEKGIKDVEDRIKSQEVEADRLENLLLSENLKEFRSKPVPKEPPPSSSSPVTVTTTKITTDLDNNIVITKTPVVLDSSSRPTTPRSRPPSETGEAILKLLEDHLSPRVSPSPATNDDGTTADGGGSGSGNTTSSTHHNPLKSSTTTTTLVKNPNGVWV